MTFTDCLDHRTGFTADDVQQQCGGALDSLASQPEIHAALETVRSIRMQSVGTGLAGQHNWIEKSSLKEQIARALIYAAVLAAHYAGNRQCAVMIGDHQGIGPQSDLLTIEQNELFALLGHPHTNAAMDFGKIEGVHRLPLLEHDVIRHVDRGINAADIRTTQALHHPRRSRLAQVDIANHATDIAGAILRCKQLDGADFVMCSGNRLDCHRREGAAVNGANFASQALQGQAVAAIWSQPDLDAGIIEPKVVADIRTDRCITRQLQ